jgi:hypothetical protein
MDDSTVNGDRACLDSMVIETARRYPLAMAAWLLADCAAGWATAAQDRLEEKMRAAVTA